MEIDIKEQSEKLQNELNQLQVQLQQIEQVRNNTINAILKTSGAIELLQKLEKEKKDGE